MPITASMVKELRDATGIAMMKCKKALEEAEGDMEKAIELLRKQGLATAEKKAGRATSAGGLGIASEGGKGAIVMLGCETDFVSGNDLFKTFVTDLAGVALSNQTGDVDSLKAATLGDGSVDGALIEKIQQLGENMAISKVVLLEGDAVAGYNHGGRVATLVAGSGDAEALRNVAMHVAAASPAPIALDKEGVPADIIEKERAIIAESPDVQAKPENIRPKIIDGKLGRFYKENVLLEQEMLVDNEDGGSVAAYAKAKGITITGFAREEL